VTDEKGYIQFRCDWDEALPPAQPFLLDLIRWRNRLRDLELIGLYPNGIGYGNISARNPNEDEFVISGTATGGLAALGPEHFTSVVGFDFQSIWLRCRGPLQASSESLSHAAVYRSAPTARAVIHVHHLETWERLRNLAPTTDPKAEAGTPAMAWAIEDLLKHPPIADGFFVMGGHRDGLISFGQTLDEAGERMLQAIGAMTGG
jgi:L-ribulose-5-phosphate 4-epimerase